MSRERDGHARIYMRNNSYYCVPLEQYGAIREAWMAGERWLEMPSFHGGTITVKLAEVEAVREISAEVYAAIEAAEIEEEKAKMLRGGE